MLDQFERNRQLLARLIYTQPREFTENKIKQLYLQETGSLLVDAVHSISSFLRLQTEHGSLAYRDGQYYVKPS